MAKRGRPKGSLNKKTLEKQVQEIEQNVALETADAVLTKEELPSAVDDAADVMSKYEKPLGETQKKVLDGPKTKTISDLPRNPSIVEILAWLKRQKVNNLKLIS